MKGVPLNSSCPCGSGKKYKLCCYHKNYNVAQEEKIEATFSIHKNGKIKRYVTSLDSIPTHNKNGLKPKITQNQMIDLCLDNIYKILEKEKVGMLLDLVNFVVKTMDIIPTFTYREFAERMEKDDRFTIYQMQVCCLKGDNPIRLMSERLE
jgi:hypothetical protein